MYFHYIHLQLLSLTALRFPPNSFNLHPFLLNPSNFVYPSPSLFLNNPSSPVCATPVSWGGASHWSVTHLSGTIPLKPSLPSLEAIAVRGSSVRGGGSCAPPCCVLKGWYRSGAGTHLPGSPVGPGVQKIPFHSDPFKPLVSVLSSTVVPEPWWMMVIYVPSIAEHLLTRICTLASC